VAVPLSGLKLSPLQLRQRPEVFQVLQGTLPGRVALQQLEPDYWQRFETLSAAFTQARVTTRPRRSRLWPFR